MGKFRLLTTKSAKLFSLHDALAFLRHRRDPARFQQLNLKFNPFHILYPDPDYKLGLVIEDKLITMNDPYKKEAVNRLTFPQQQARDWRLIQANLLVMQKTELPKEMWTTPEQYRGVQCMTDRLVTIAREQDDLELFRNQ